MQGRFAAAAGPAVSNDFDSKRHSAYHVAGSIVRLLAAAGLDARMTPSLSRMPF